LRGGREDLRWRRELAAVDQTRQGARAELHEAEGNPGFVDLCEEDNRDGETSKCHGRIARNSNCSRWMGEGAGGALAEQL
jgi:hypothetical protein